MRPTPDPRSDGQESVWDYPRPAIAERTSRKLEVILGGRTIAATTSGVRTLETSHPPTYYFPPNDVDDDVLQAVGGTTMCEWKGQAHYYDVVVGKQRRERAAWYYDDPVASFAILKDHIAFMPGQMDACLVDGETARPQAGDFYGGWITSDLAGPFKGPPGTRGW